MRSRSVSWLTAVGTAAVAFFGTVGPHTASLAPPVVRGTGALTDNALHAASSGDLSGAIASLEAALGPGEWVEASTEAILRSADAGDPALASAWLAELQQRGARPHVSCFEAVIASYAAFSRGSAAEAILKNMQQVGLEPSATAFGNVVQAFVANGDLKSSLERLDSARSAGVILDASVYKSVILGSARRGRTSAAQQVLDKMLGDSLVPDAETFTALISAYAKDAKLPEAEQLLDAMRQAGMEPNAPAWGWTILASAGFDASQGRKRHETRTPEGFFRQMLDSGVAPTPFAVGALAKAVGPERCQELCGQICPEALDVPEIHLQSTRGRRNSGKRKRAYDAFPTAGKLEVKTLDDHIQQFGKRAYGNGRDYGRPDPDWD